MLLSKISLINQLTVSEEKKYLSSFQVKDEKKIQEVVDLTDYERSEELRKAKSRTKKNHSKFTLVCIHQPGNPVSNPNIRHHVYYHSFTTILLEISKMLIKPKIICSLYVYLVMIKSLFCHHNWISIHHFLANWKNVHKKNRWKRSKCAFFKAKQHGPESWSATVQRWGRWIIPWQHTPPCG